MKQHTQPSKNSRRGALPRWLGTFEGVDWDGHREIVAGPLPTQDAIELEHQLIEIYKDTVVNQKPANPYGSGRQRVGISRSGESWRVQRGVGKGRRVQKIFPTYCQALNWRLQPFSQEKIQELYEQRDCRPRRSVRRGTSGKFGTT